MEKTITIRNETKGKLPRLPFERMKSAVVGKRYELSLVFVPPKTSQVLNAKYRGKKRPTNVLSFPLSKNEGEIFLDLSTARKDAPRFSMPQKKFIALLFIHALLHLKGFDHGSTMERTEAKMLKKLKL